MKDPLLGPIILQILLISINAFFASTEMAVISLNSNKLRKMAEDGDKDAIRMLKLVDEPANFLSTIQILSFRTFSQPGLNACILSHKACIKAIKRRNPSPFCGKIKSVKKTLLNKKRKESSWLIILQILMQ